MDFHRVVTPGAEPTIILRAVRAAAAAWAFSGLLTTAQADMLYMQNGDQITGKIKRVWDGELFIETDYADEFAVSLDSVARIESEEAFEIELRDDSETTGRFATSPSGGMILVTETETLPLSPTAIEEMSEPEQYFEWESRSDFSVGGSRGNAETSDFLWQANGSVKFGDHRHQLDLRVDRKSQDGITTKDQLSSSYVYRWFFTDRWFLGAGMGYERDPIRQLTDRYTPGLGVGFQVFDDADRELHVFLQAIGVQERIAGQTNESTTARWQLRYRHNMTDGLEFFHDHRLSAYLTGRTNRIADTTTGFRWEAWSNVYVNAQLNWNWESDPAAGQEQTDITYALGIGLQLD